MLDISWLARRVGKTFVSRFPFLNDAVIYLVFPYIHQVLCKLMRCFFLFLLCSLLLYRFSTIIYHELCRLGHFRSNTYWPIGFVKLIFEYSPFLAKLSDLINLSHLLRHACGNTVYFQFINTRITINCVTGNFYHINIIKAKVCTCLLLLAQTAELILMEFILR